jgi:hypothetical protein
MNKSIFLKFFLIFNVGCLFSEDIQNLKMLFFQDIKNLKMLWDFFDESDSIYSHEYIRGIGMNAITEGAVLVFQECLKKYSNYEDKQERCFLQYRKRIIDASNFTINQYISK